MAVADRLGLCVTPGICHDPEDFSSGAVCISSFKIKRSLSDIHPIPSSHKVGLKRVLLAAEESGCAITQITVTDLKAGEVAEAHCHADMQEGFYVMSGELDMVLDGEVEHCKEGYFVWVRCGVRHELRAVTNVRMMTIGCLIA